MALSLDNLTVDMIVKMNKFIKQLAKAWCSRQEGFIQITQILSGKLIYYNFVPSIIYVYITLVL